MTKQVDDAIRKRSKELRIDVTYSKKGHYNAAAIWNITHYSLGLSVAILGAIVGIKSHTLSTRSISYLSLIIAVLGAAITFLKPQEKALQHKLAGDNFDGLLQHLSNFENVKMLQGNDNEHTSELDKLTNDKIKLNSSSLPIPKLAYIITKDGIQKGEADYTEDL